MMKISKVTRHSKSVSIDYSGDAQPALKYRTTHDLRPVFPCEHVQNSAIGPQDTLASAGQHVFTSSRRTASQITASSRQQFELPQTRIYRPGVTMSTIPIVDFSAYSNTDCLHDKISAAQDIDNAFRSQGFVYLKNHGVSKERVEQCFAWVR